MEIFKNKIQKFYSKFWVMFNPLAIIPTMVVGAIISCLIPDLFNNWVLDNRESKIFLFILIVHGYSFLIFLVSEHYKDKIEDLEEEHKKVKRNLEETIKVKENSIAENKRQVDISYKLLESKHSMFTKHMRNDLLKEKLSKVIHEIDCLDAIQIHKYNLSVNADEVVIHINSECSFENTHSNINILGQFYCKLPSNMYVEFNKIYDDYNIYLMYPNNVDINKLYSNCKQFIMNYYPVQSDKVKEAELKTYRNQPGYSRILNTVINIHNELSELGTKSIQFSMPQLKDSHNTGIFTALLLNKDSIYKYANGSHLKRNRCYFSFIDVFNDETKIVTFIFNDITGDDKKQENLIHKMVAIYEKHLHDFN